jgi:hypothetical protein
MIGGALIVSTVRPSLHLNVQGFLPGARQAMY